MDQAGWLTLREFADVITISQMTPGPLAVNTSTFVGIRLGGVTGAVAATLGCVSSGFVLSLLLYRFVKNRSDRAWVTTMLAGLKAASVGLIGAAGVSILALSLFGMESDRPFSFSQLDYAALIIFILSLAALRKYKANPIIIITLTGVAGFFVYY